ncbi:MAG: hypothetical protein RIS64_2801 [Bacteroidota bacterium]|jgi:hypothetical protein
MNKKAICYLTNTMQPQERALFEAQLNTDAELAADFEAQKKIFQKMEKIRLSNKIQKLVAQDRLHRAWQQKWIQFGIGASVLIWSIATWQYVVNQLDTYLKPQLPIAKQGVQLQQNTLKAIGTESQKLSTPQKTSSHPTKALKQGVQLPKPLPKDSIPYANAILNLAPSSKMQDPSLVVGAGSDTNHLIQLLPSSVQIEQAVFQQRLDKMYKQWLLIEKEKYIYRYNKWCGTADCQNLSSKVVQLLNEYYQRKSPDPVLEESGFNADLSWIVKAMYNIEVQEMSAAKYCLAKIDNDSYFLNEKQFCEILLQNPEDRNKEALNLFIKDASSLFHEKAKELLKK